MKPGTARPLEVHCQRKASRRVPLLHRIMKLGVSMCWTLCAVASESILQSTKAPTGVHTKEAFKYRHCASRYIKYRLRATHNFPPLPQCRVAFPPQIIPPPFPLGMHHRPSYRQSHTPVPAYNQGYGGYGNPPPPQGGAGYPGYAPAPPQRGPPPGADPEVWHWFSTVDTDRSGSITVIELQSALVNGTFFFDDLSVIRLFVACARG